MNIKSEDFERHLRNTVEPNIISQISEDALKKGVQGMANAVNNVQTTRSR